MSIQLSNSNPPASGGFTLGTFQFDPVTGEISVAVPLTAPGGSNGDIQYNNSGVFGGSAATITAAGSATIPSGQVIKWSTDAGISRLGAASLAIGNGTDGDFTGTLKLTTLNVQGLTVSVPVLTDASKNLVSGSLSGNTTKLVTESGSITSGHVLTADANGNAVDGGAPSGLAVAWSSLTSTLSSGQVIPYSDAGISRLGAASFALGNGTAADFTAALKLAALSMVNATAIVGVSLVLTQVSVSGAVTTYTGTITGGGSNALTGATVTTSGFAASSGANNVANMVIVTSTATTFTVVTSTQVNETHAGAVISGAVVNSPIQTFSTKYGANATDSWTIQVVTGSVAANPTSVLTILHSGSSGVASISVPRLVMQNGNAFVPSASGISGISDLPISNSQGSFVQLTSSGSPSMGNSGSTKTFNLGNGANDGTFNFKNSTASTALVNQNGILVSLWGTCWNGANITDKWGLQSITGAGSNPTQTFTLTHTGSTGAIALQLPSALTLRWSTDVGFSRLGAASLALGNGTANDTTGNLSLNQIIKYNAVSTVKSGVGSQVAFSDLTAQSAAIAATTIYAVPAAGVGLYRISYVATVTTAATTSCVLGGGTGFQVKFTNDSDNVVKTSNPTTPVISAVNATGTTISGVCYANCKASTNLQYIFDYTSVGGTAMVYDLNIRVEYLG